MFANHVQGHWVLKPENSLVWHKTVFDWINHYSGITERETLRRLSGLSVVTPMAEEDREEENGEEEGPEDEGREEEWWNVSPREV